MHTTITYQQQIDRINKLLPEGQTYDRMYRAFEGGVRVISRDKNGREYRYNAVFDDDGGVNELQRM